MAGIWALSSQSSFGALSWVSRIPGYDKIIHTLIYGCLSLTFFRFFFWRGGMSAEAAAKYLVWAVVCSVLFGVTDEVHQAFVPRREPSCWDLLADGGGALLFCSMAVRRVRGTRFRRARRPVVP